MIKSAPVILILGAGPNVGQATAKRFADAGYRVATVSRHAGEPPAIVEDGTLSIKADLEDVTSPARIFNAVRDFFKATPSVVVYNAAHRTPAPDPDNMFSIAPPALDADLSLMLKTPWAAAGEAFKAWFLEPQDEGNSRKRTFIYTGNGMPKHVLPIPDVVTIGTAKAGALCWIQVADAVYKHKGCRFFYADERTKENKDKGPSISGESHAEFYMTLAESSQDIPSYATFVDGKYIKF